MKTMVYIVFRNGIERTVEGVFKSIESANNFTADKTDRHKEIYARRNKTTGEWKYPHSILYEVYCSKLRD